MVQMLRQHGRSRSTGWSGLTLRPINVGAPNRLMFIRALLARRGVEDGVRRLRRRLEKAEAVFLSIEALETRSTSGENVPDGFTAVVHVGKGRYGDARGHWRLPTRSPHASKQAIARLMPSAMPTKAPASRNAAMVASCLSVTRPPSFLSSKQKSLLRCSTITSGSPARAPNDL